MKKAKEVMIAIENRINARSMAADITEYMFSTKLDTYTLGKLCAFHTNVYIESPYSGSQYFSVDTRRCRDYYSCKVGSDYNEIYAIYQKVAEILRKNGYICTILAECENKEVTTYSLKKTFFGNETTEHKENKTYVYPVLKISAKPQEECICSTKT